MINVFTGLNLLLSERKIWKLKLGIFNIGSPSCICSSQTLPVLGLRKTPVLVSSSCSISAIKLEAFFINFSTYTKKFFRKGTLVKAQSGSWRWFQIIELVNFKIVICNLGCASRSDFSNWAKLHASTTAYAAIKVNIVPVICKLSVVSISAWAKAIIDRNIKATSTGFMFIIDNHVCHNCLSPTFLKGFVRNIHLTKTSLVGFLFTNEFVANSSTS